MNADSGIQIGDIWAIVRRRGKIVAGVSLVLFLGAYWIAMAIPNVYSSYATVLVTPQTVDPQLVAAGVPESDLNNRLFLMTAQILSRGRLSRVIDKLELYPEESEYMVREEVIDLMRSMVSVSPVISELSASARRTATDEINQFKIEFIDKRAETAMRVAQKLSNDFIEQHIEGRITQSQKSLEFIEGELGRLADRIRDIEAKVAQVKAENPGRLPEDMVTSQRQVERLISDLSFAQRAYAEATSDEAFFRSQMSNAVIADRNEITPARRLKLLDLMVAELKAKGFTEKHPDMQKVTQEIEELKLAIARQKEAGDELASAGEVAMTFAQQNAEAERLRATLRRESAGEEISRLQGRIDQVHTQLAETPAVAEVLDGLKREYHHLFTSYQDFSNRQLEATVQAQLERRQLGEQFKVLEAAFIAPEPASPDRPLIIILGLLFALGVGGAIGIVLESLDTSVHSAYQLQTAIGIPVLAAIPRIQLEADHAAARRSRLQVAFGATAVTMFALVGGFANYIWVNGMPVFLSAAIEYQDLGGASPADAGASDTPVAGG